MNKLAFANFSETHLTILAMLIFFGYFTLISIKAISMSLKQIQKLENLPLEEEIEVQHER
jgi:hypothetical protein